MLSVAPTAAVGRPIRSLAPARHYVRKAADSRPWGFGPSNVGFYANELTLPTRHWRSRAPPSTKSLLCRMRRDPGRAGRHPLATAFRKGEHALVAPLSTLPDYVLYLGECLIFQLLTGLRIEIVSTPFNSPGIREKGSIMRCFVHEQVVLSRPLEGPLAAHVVSFANFVSEQGYSGYSLKRQVRIAAGFSRWLERRGIPVRNIGTDHLVGYLRYRTRHVRPGRGDAAALRHLIDFLRHEGVIQTEKTATRRLTGAERCVREYEQYLREARGLANATVINYVPFVRDLLKHHFGDGRITLSRLGAGDVVRFVQRQVPRLHLKRAKLMTCALRSYLHYARYRGDTTLDLAAAVPVVANCNR